jgi:hypothetical protein
MIRVTTEQPEHLDEIEEPTKTEPNHEPWFGPSSHPPRKPEFDPEAIDTATRALRHSVERLRLRVAAHRRELAS